MSNHHVSSSRRVLFLALGLTLIFAVIEALAGLYSGSIALLGDAGHMLTDGLSLGIAAFAASLALLAPSKRHSYGLGRIELLAALVNALFMIAVVVVISTAAVERLINPQPVKGEAVILVAFIGLLINILVAWLLTRSENNINVRAALLHVLGDLLGSIAALISGVVISVSGWYPIDPILSLVIVLLILFSSLRLLRDGLHLLLDGVPNNIELQVVGKSLVELDGILEVHDLHIWSLSAERTAISAHLVIDDLSHWEQRLSAARDLVHDQFNIDHCTFQPELQTATGMLMQIEEPYRTE